MKPLLWIYVFLVVLTVEISEIYTQVSGNEVMQFAITPDKSDSPSSNSKQSPDEKVTTKTDISNKTTSATKSIPNDPQTTTKVPSGETQQVTTAASSTKLVSIVHKLTSSTEIPTEHVSSAVTSSSIVHKLTPTAIPEVSPTKPSAPSVVTETHVASSTSKVQIDPALDEKLNSILSSQKLDKTLGEVIKEATTLKLTLESVSKCYTPFAVTSNIFDHELPFKTVCAEFYQFFLDKTPSDISVRNLLETTEFLINFCKDNPYGGVSYTTLSDEDIEELISKEAQEKTSRE